MRSRPGCRLGEFKQRRFEKEGVRVVAKASTNVVEKSREEQEAVVGEGVRVVDEARQVMVGKYKGERKAVAKGCVGGVAEVRQVGVEKHKETWSKSPRRTL